MQKVVENKSATELANKNKCLYIPKKVHLE